RDAEVLMSISSRGRPARAIACTQRTSGGTPEGRSHGRPARALAWAALTLFLLLLSGCEETTDKFYSAEPPDVIETRMTYAPKTQTPEQIEAKSKGCMVCHKIESPSMHKNDVGIGCVDCHGGDALAKEKEKAHIQPR